MKKILVIFLFLLCYKVNASIVIMDADSGRVLYNKNMNEKIKNYKTLRDPYIVVVGDKEAEEGNERTQKINEILSWDGSNAKILDDGEIVAK